MGLPLWPTLASLVNWGGGSSAHGSASSVRRSADLALEITPHSYPQGGQQHGGQGRVVGEECRKQGFFAERKEHFRDI